MTTTSNLGVNKKILCIGEALIDMICTDKGSSLKDGQYFLKKPGGAPTNVAAAIAALGGEVEMSAKVGKDPFGTHLIEVMKEFKIGTQHVIQDPNHFTTFAFVSLLENGERDFYFNRGADGMLNDEDVNSIDISSFGIAHFGSATGFLPGPLQSTYKNMLMKSKESGLFISFDPNYRHLLFGNDQEAFIKHSWEFISHSDFFKVSDEEALLLTGKKSVDEAALVFSEKSNGIFAITLGKDGTLLGFQQRTHLVSSIEVNPVDTTGAGDAFVGALLYQLIGYSKEEILNLDLNKWLVFFSNANKAGARTCEYMGAMEAFKHLSSDIFN
jgi:fructokinase